MKERKINVRNKKVIIEVSLVNESIEVMTEQIRKDIIDELSEGAIPWCKQIERVVVEEKQNLPLFFFLHLLLKQEKSCARSWDGEVIG